MKVVRQGTLHQFAIAVLTVQIRKAGVEVFLNRNGRPGTHGFSLTQLPLGPIPFTLQLGIEQLIIASLGHLGKRRVRSSFSLHRWSCHLRMSQLLWSTIMRATSAHIGRFLGGAGGLAT